jgi:hypothetical protein
MTGDLSCGLLPWWCAGHWFLTAPEDLDDTHRAAAARAWLAQGERGGLDIWVLRDVLFRLPNAKQGPYLGAVRQMRTNL